MKRQINKRLQSLLLATIATIFLLGAFASTFAQGKINNNLLTFDYLSSNASQNFWLNNSPSKFDPLNPQSNNLFAVNLKEDDEYPKPDFSDIEKWYDITKYEYGDIEGGDNNLYFWYKPKKYPRPWFNVEYRDKDGAQVRDSPEAAFDFGKTPGVGEVSKGYAGTPFEKEMKRVVSVKFVRFKS